MQGCRTQVFAALIAVFQTGQAVAQEFDMRFGGLRLGTLTIDLTQTGDAYSAAVRIRTTGLAGAARPVRFAGTVQGQSDDWPRPTSYDETADAGRRVSSSRLVWAGKTPRIEHYSSDPVETAALPTDLTDAIDPASAVFAALTGPPLCGRSFTVFDGQRLNRVSFAVGEATETGLTCGGSFTRIAGYPAKDMAARSGFALGLTYQTDGDTMRLIGAEVQTIYGKLRLKQR